MNLYLKVAFIICRERKKNFEDLSCFFLLSIMPTIFQVSVFTMSQNFLLSQVPLKYTSDSRSPMVFRGSSAPNLYSGQYSVYIEAVLAKDWLSFFYANVRIFVFLGQKSIRKNLRKKNLFSVDFGFEFVFHSSGDLTCVAYNAALISKVKAWKIIDNYTTG